jgi:hypothetical protein
MNKPHLYFRNPEERIVSYKARTGGGGDNEAEKKKKDFTRMSEVFSVCQQKFYQESQTRHSNRTIDLPIHFDLIELTFFAGFDQPKYESYYIDKFGLVLLHLSLFNRKGLFAIDNKDKFDFFFQQITYFIENHLEEGNNQYDGKIHFIKKFKLFSTNDMFGNIDNYNVIHLSFLGNNSFIENSHIKPQKKALEDLLKQSGVEFSFNENEGEIYELAEDVLSGLLDNFDFIYASCSGSGAIVQPNSYNTPKREFGFEITNSDEDLPIIGVIDTGVSNQTPLASILVGENGDFDTTGTGSFIDNTDHGTGVAAFAAFGTKLIPGYQGQVEADAKILPIKILNTNEGSISQQKTIGLIKEANELYNVRIFTLTIGYTNFPLRDNQEFSSYARMLDELAAELDILIFISTTNHMFNIQGASDYPAKFLKAEANIAPPAESMNNITIGATADNFENNNINGLSTSKEFPAMYSRKFHYNFADDKVFNDQTGNNYLRKPDILIGGGDYFEYFFIGEPGYDDRGDTCLEVLSANLEERTFRRLGTSYATPLAANLAAKLLKVYPNLEMQTVKALIINSSNAINTGEIFKSFSNKMNLRIMGYGAANMESLVYSSDNRVIMVIEDEIYPEYIKLYPVNLPTYLNEAKRKNGLLKIDATLCFKFKPKPDNQLLYCPLHVSFPIGKNLTIEDSHIEQRIDKNGDLKDYEIQDGYNGNSTKEIRLSSSGKGWVQDYYYKGKIVSNVQKISFNVAGDRIVDEENCFKIAINAAFHKLLSIADQEPYNTAIPYSLVITIEQIPIKEEVLDSLYAGLIAVNDLRAITEIDLEAEFVS